MKTRPAVCQHYRFEPVRLLLTGELVAHVCADCYEPLPPDWQAQPQLELLMAQVDSIDACLAALDAAYPGAIAGKGARRLIDRRHDLMEQARELSEITS